MSALPRAVQKKIDEANALLEAQKNPVAVVDPAPAPAADPAPAAAPAPVAAADPAPAPAPAPVATIPVPDYEQRYKVLQGKYNAEVPRLQTHTRELANEVRQLKESLVATQAILGSFSQTRGAAPADAPSAKPAAVKLVKDEEIREFGPDLIDVMRRVTREEQAAFIPEIESRVRPVAAQAERADRTANANAQQQAATAQQGVLTLLNREVSGWNEQNQDEGFLTWLGQIDPYTGVERGALLTQAFQGSDGPRVVAFFKGYLKEHAVVTPPSAPAAPAPAVVPQKSLKDLVAPGTPKAAPASAQDGSGRRVWKQSEIGLFYAALAAGKFQGEAAVAEANKIERDIFAAQKDGRVLMNR